MKTKQGYSDFPFEEFENYMDKYLAEVIQKLPNHFFAYIKQKLLETKTFFKESKFQIELVVDTNILLSEVRGLMLYKKSFLLSIVDNPFIKLYSPQTIKKELYEKIDKQFPKQKKTKNLDLNECKRQADILLSKISLLNKVDEDAYQKAKTQMGRRDEKDVPFLAVHFSIKSHGILTKDKDFTEPKETRIWKLADVGQVLTEIKKGTFSFFVMNTSLPPILYFIYRLIASIWAIIIEIVAGFVKVFASILQGSIEGLSKLPHGLLGVVGFGLLIVLLLDELREKVGGFLKKVWGGIKEIIKGLKEFFNAIWESLKTIWEALKPFVRVSLQLFTFLANSSKKLILQLETLEVSRPTN
ncbi:MAG: hypothetical protein OHK0036_08770 [Bacteroidia bacterium]